MNQSRETMSAPAAKPAMPNPRRQLRTFALVWTGLTLFFGACTFISIYAATGSAANSASIANKGIPPASVAQIATPTLVASPSDAAGTNDQTAQQTQTGGGSVPTLAQADQGILSTPTGIAMVPTLIPPAQGGNSTAIPTNTSQANPPAQNNAQTNVQPAAPTATPIPPTTGPTATNPATKTAAPPTPTILPIKDTAFDLGIAVQDNPDANTYKNWVHSVATDLKLNWMKAQVVWRDMEKVKGKIDWTSMDVEIKQMSTANVKILLSITHAPDWARDPGAPTNQPGHLDGPPHDPQDLANFITTILKRYPNMIQAVEVWNEPNLDREWATAPQLLSATRYVTLLKTAHDAIKAVDPNIIVISAALSPTGNSQEPNWTDDFVYFQQLIDAGMLQYADCVGAHSNGYNVPPDQDAANVVNRPKAIFRGPFDNNRVHSWYFKTTLEGYEKKIQAAGSNVQLCVTEFGWGSTEGLTKTPLKGFEFASDNSLADQASFTDAAITEMQKWGFVRLAFLFNLNYGPQTGWSMDGAVADNNLWCIIGKDWSVRPVWQKIVDRNFRGQPRKASS